MSTLFKNVKNKTHRKRNHNTIYYIQFQIIKQDYIAVVTAAFRQNLFCVHNFFLFCSFPLSQILQIILFRKH